ncbi:MAG TPA: response regulator [Longimicrobiales bacterium]|nr:response regulator [Longimicrobiales bacterium]
MEHVIKLLIVDDETRFLDAIARRLAKRGFDVATATNGHDAVQLAHNEKFDLALLDLKMPGMDGGQVLRTLKQEHRFLEAVILTGHGSLDSAVELTKLGAFGYLPKPYEMDKLVDVLKDAYQARLQKKFAADRDMQDRILAMATGESALGILRRLRELDDERR